MILTVISVSIGLNCCRILCLCVSVFKFSPCASLLTPPRVHLCSGLGPCPLPAMWNWVEGGEDKQNRGFKN